MSTATAAQLLAGATCYHCQKTNDPNELSECVRCGAGFCKSCYRCICNDTDDAVEDLHRAADNRERHAELLAGLYALLAQLQAS